MNTQKLQKEAKNRPKNHRKQKEATPVNKSTRKHYKNK
jgi:hypothetical protein